MRGTQEGALDIGEDHWAVELVRLVQDGGLLAPLPDLIAARIAFSQSE